MDGVEHSNWVAMAKAAVASQGQTSHGILRVATASSGRSMLQEVFRRRGTSALEEAQVVTSSPLPYIPHDAE
jgi:hypothetical protein